MKERATFVYDIWTTSQFLFVAPNKYEEKVIRKKWNRNSSEILSSIIELFLSIKDFNEKNIESNFKNHLEKNNWSIGMVLPVFRLSVTGLGTGPSMFAVSSLLGKKEVISRMRKAINTLSPHG